MFIFLSAGDTVAPTPVIVTPQVNRAMAPNRPTTEKQHSPPDEDENNSDTITLKPEEVKIVLPGTPAFKAMVKGSQLDRVAGRSPAVP